MKDVQVTLYYRTGNVDHITLFGTYTERKLIDHISEVYKAYKAEFTGENGKLITVKGSVNAE